MEGGRRKQKKPIFAYALRRLCWVCNANNTYAQSSKLKLTKIQRKDLSYVIIR